MRAMSLACALCLGACSSGNSNIPPELGNCVPPPDASCTHPAGGGGSASGSDASPATNNGATSTTTTCGGADLLVTTPNVYCDPCITSMCCQADMACTGQCESLLQCTQLCMQGDTVCVGSCGNNPTVQAGVASYLDFANCVTASCAGTCPTLQHN